MRNLPTTESPAWAGLPMNVEKLNRMKQAESLVGNIKLLQDIGDEDSKAADDDDKAAWLVGLQKRIDLYLESLPAELKKMKREGSLVKNPLFRFLERECSVLSSLLVSVRNDLYMVREVCTGVRKSTNQIKQLALQLHADTVPPQWKYNNDKVPVVSASEWVRDFAARVEQMLKLSTSQDHGRSGIWLGGLISPGAFLIAT